MRVLLFGLLSLGFFVSTAAALAVHQDHSPEKRAAASSNTNWPQWFVTNWTMYSTPLDANEPPYTSNNGLPDPPYRATRGASFYDWTKFAMLGVYVEECVPIFPHGSRWPCHFLNANNVSYLLTFDDQPKGHPPCCIFRKPWLPPSPTFVQHIPYNTSTLLNGETVDWYVLNGPMPAPFGYGFYHSSSSPAAFYFRGFLGWTMQVYANFTNEQPQAAVFEIPSVCANATLCKISRGTTWP